MAIVTAPSEEVAALVRALGLDPGKVTALNLCIRPGEPVTVTVRQIVESEPGQLAEAFERFELVRRGDRVRLPVVNMVVGEMASREGVMHAVREMAKRHGR